MAFPWLALAPIGGALIDAFSGGRRDRSNERSTSEANATNIMLQQEANRLSVAEAAKARQFSKWSQKDAQKFNASQALTAFARNQASVRSARRFDKREAAKARQFEAKRMKRVHEVSVADTLAAEARSRDYLLADEARGRDYAEADRDEHREYNDPAAVRARLEAAGINPLTGQDGSGGFVSSSGAMSSSAMIPAMSNPLSPTSVRSDIAQAFAASSGQVPGAYADIRAASVMPSLATGGTNFGGAFQAVSDNLYTEAEQELRRTQLELENSRLVELMQRASLTPTVPGMYGSPGGGPSIGQDASQRFRNPGDSLRYGGIEIPTAADTSNAEDWQVRWGEPGEWVGGMITGARDIIHNWMPEASVGDALRLASRPLNNLGRISPGRLFDAFAPQEDYPGGVGYEPLRLTVTR